MNYPEDDTFEGSDATAPVSDAPDAAIISPERQAARRRSSLSALRASSSRGAPLCSLPRLLKSSLWGSPVEWAAGVGPPLRQLLRARFRPAIFHGGSDGR